MISYKITLAGERYNNGGLTLQGSHGRLWSTSVIDGAVRYFRFNINGDIHETNEGFLSKGYSIRCIKAEKTTSKLKKTGQTKSYDQDGNEVTDGSVKDDGYYQKGMTSNYERNDTSEIVTDHITGLMWQDDERVKTVTKPWVTQVNYNAGNYYDISGDTATTYCSELILGGYSDWRLPTRKELFNIVDFGHHHPAIKSTFINTFLSTYWSITSYRADYRHAWEVGFSEGSVRNYEHKDSNNYIRCVREREL